MSKPINFDGPYLKTERADHHIRQLEDVFRRYGGVNENAAVAKPNKYAAKSSLPIAAAFPRHTPTILGDALHNLRASLDHAYCILIEANDGTIDRWSKFPIHEKGSRQDFEGATNGQAKAARPSDKIIKLIIDEIQPYPGGNGDTLVALHSLDIADKHIVLLPVEQHTFMQDVRFAGGGGMSGIILVTSGAPAVSFGPGAGLEQGYNNKASIEICFGRGQPYQGKPILPTLRTMADTVIKTLGRLEEVANT